MAITDVVVPQLSESVSEATLLTVLTRAASAPCTAWVLLSDQLGTRDVGAVLACAEAVGAAFADAGCPLS